MLVVHLPICGDGRDDDAGAATYDSEAEDDTLQFNMWTEARKMKAMTVGV